MRHIALGLPTLSTPSRTGFAYSSTVIYNLKASQRKNAIFVCTRCFVDAGKHNTLLFNRNQ